jgi:hypothetical protein
MYTQLYKTLEISWIFCAASDLAFGSFGYDLNRSVTHFQSRHMDNY